MSGCCGVGATASLKPERRGPVPQRVFKTRQVWQPQAGSVRLRGRSASKTAIALYAQTMVRLLTTRPVLFFALLTLLLGLLGSVGGLISKYGPQPVPSGAIGFAYGITLGVFFGLTFYVFRRARGGRTMGVRVIVLVGTLAIIGLFLLLAR